MKIFHINLIVSILLIVGGFLCPPMGSIDGSVLTAVGLLILFSVVEKLPEAIAAGRSVKILDEATSALDSATEAVLLERLASEYRGCKTILMITHRECALTYADEILRLDVQE